MALPPSNVPSTIGIPGGAPNDPLAVVLYLTQIASALNNWAAQVANAINAPLAGTLILAHLPTTDPHVVGQVWNNANILTVSAG